MKKMKWFFLAIVFAAVSSAFATVKPAQLDTLYYRDGTGFHEIPANDPGNCIEGTNFCEYTLKSGSLPDNDPNSYTGVPGTEDQQWVP